LIVNFDLESYFSILAKNIGVLENIDFGGRPKLCRKMLPSKNEDFLQ